MNVNAHAHRLVFRLTSFCVVVANLSACSALISYAYFKPQAPGGVLTSSDVGAPRNAVVFRHDSHQVTIYAEPLQSETKAVGPPLLPIIPAPSNDQKASRIAADFNTVRIYVTLWLRQGYGEVDFGKMTLAEDTQRKELSPVKLEKWRTDLHKFVEVQPDQSLTASKCWPSAQYVLSYVLKNHSLASLRTFQFKPNGFKIDGQQIDLPVVSFDRVSGAALSTAP